MPYTGEREGLKCEICRVGADFGPELEGRKDGFVDLAVSATEKSQLALHCELGAGLLVVDVVVAGLIADFPFAVGGVGG